MLQITGPSCTLSWLRLGILHWHYILRYFLLGATKLGGLIVPAAVFSIAKSSESGLDKGAVQLVVQVLI